jgi:hypothetical protein
MKERDRRWGKAAFLIVVLAFVVTKGKTAPIPGHVESWGYNFFGQTNPPAGLDGVIGVAAGGEHSLALRMNGTVVAWGNNSEGQTIIPPGLNNVVAIAAATHCVVLTRSGTVVVWGNNNAIVTTVPPGLNGIAAIAAGNIAGNSYTMALRSNGTVVAWGLQDSTTNVPAGLSGVVGIAAGNSHALALKSNGTVVGWGENNVGQATAPPGLTGVVAVRAGQSSSLAVKSDGTVVKWGSFADVPAGLDRVVDVQVGANHALALRSDGTVVAWGNDSFGQGTALSGLTGVTAIAAGGNHNLVVTARPIILSISPPVVVNVGESATFLVSASGAPLGYQWRRNGTDISRATNQSLTLTNAQASDGGTYTVLVSNPYGSTLSPSTFLSFPPPVITLQPQSLIRYRDQDASFSVAASGVVPLSFQWRKDDANLLGAKATTLTLTNLRSTDAGHYQVIVTDAVGGSMTSDVATLTVIDPTLTNSVTLTPITDTSIFSSGGNPQGVTTILVGTRRNGILDRGLLRFDLTSLPANAVIQSADLRLTLTRVPRTPADSNFSLYRVYKPWGADASWADATTGVPWSAPGGLAGVDYASSSSATGFVIGGGVYDFGPSAPLAADVQAWLADPGTNQGWLFQSESETSLGSARHFGSSESAQPPQLLLQYTTPPPRPRLTHVMASAGNLVFRFDGAPGWFYRVEGRDNVAAGPWTTVTNVSAGPATNPIMISIPHDALQRFYRVVIE